MSLFHAFLTFAKWRVLTKYNTGQGLMGLVHLDVLLVWLTMSDGRTAKMLAQRIAKVSQSLMVWLHVPESSQVPAGYRVLSVRAVHQTIQDRGGAWHMLWSDHQLC